MALIYTFPHLQSPFPSAYTLLQGPLLQSLGTLLELLRSLPSAPSGEASEVAFQYGFTMAPSLRSQGSPVCQYCSGKKNCNAQKTGWGGGMFLWAGDFLGGPEMGPCTRSAKMRLAGLSLHPWPTIWERGMCHYLHLSFQATLHPVPSKLTPTDHSGGLSALCPPPCQLSSRAPGERQERGRGEVRCLCLGFLSSGVPRVTAQVG